MVSTLSTMTSRLSPRFRRPVLRFRTSLILPAWSMRAKPSEISLVFISAGTETASGKAIMISFPLPSEKAMSVPSCVPPRFTVTLQSAHWISPTLAYSSLRRSWISVAVPTVERDVFVGLVCCTATAGGRP